MTRDERKNLRDALEAIVKDLAEIGRVPAMQAGVRASENAEVVRVGALRVELDVLLGEPRDAPEDRPDIGNAPEGMHWKCPDCTARSSHATDAKLHARETGHRLPELVHSHRESWETTGDYVLCGWCAETLWTPASTTETLDEAIRSHIARCAGSVLAGPKRTEQPKRWTPEESGFAAPEKV